MFNDSSIYIAGHEGLLGSAILKKLQGYKNVILKAPDELDLTNQGATDRFFKEEEPEHVFLSTALEGGIVANQSYSATFLQANLSIQSNVFEAAQKYGAKQVIYYGSSCMYPKHCRQPIKEEFLLTGEIESTSEAYAIAKIAGIIVCKSYNSQFKTNRFIALVPNSMYGPNDDFDSDNSHVIPALIRKFHEAKRQCKERIFLWGSGNPQREFIFSEDVAEASLFAMNNADRLQNTHYNIGSGIEYSIKEVANMIAKIVDFKGKIEWDACKPDGASRKFLDTSKILSLGWRPKVSLEEGLELTYNWYLMNAGKNGHIDAKAKAQ